MTVFDGKGDLSEPVKELILSHVVFAALSISRLEPLLNFLLKVTIICVVHHDTELSLLGLVHLTEAGDVHVVEDLQDFCLVKSLATLFFTHLRNIDLLNDSELIVGQALDKISSSEGTGTEGADFLVRLELLRGLFRTRCFDHSLFRFLLC